jgi:hypothetical protein
MKLLAVRIDLLVNFNVTSLGLDASRCPPSTL